VRAVPAAPAKCAARIPKAGGVPQAGGDGGAVHCANNSTCTLFGAVFALFALQVLGLNGLGFGLIKIDWSTQPITLSAEIRDQANKVQVSHQIELPQS
jgi:hypothetical protein